MDTFNFWLVLLGGVAIGMMFSKSLRWMGKRFLAGNQKKEGGEAYKEHKQMGEKIN